MLHLHTYFRSSAAFRVRLALNVKGLPWDATVVWLPTGEHRSDAYRAINPQGLVPTLTDGELTLTQSLAIIEYLDEVHPGPKLLPADPAGRARVRALALSIACEIHPLNNPRVLNYLKTTLGQTQESVDTWYRHWVAEGFEVFEQELARGPQGTFCHGDQVSLADLCLVPQVFNARRFQVDLAPYPRLMKVFDACMSLEAFQRSQPSAQPEASRAA